MIVVIMMMINIMVINIGGNERRISDNKNNIKNYNTIF